MVEKRKVSKKKKATQTYKWIKEIFARQDQLEERITLIEKFLGGKENMKRILEDVNKTT